MQHHASCGSARKTLDLVAFERDDRQAATPSILRGVAMAGDGHPRARVLRYQLFGIWNVTFPSASAVASPAR